MKPRIYNRDMEMVGVLENASAISYTHKHNDLFTASFELPFDDPKTELCDTHFIVDIFDGEKSKGKYRILDEPDEDITSEGQMAKYSCEHVIAYLLNDVIDGYMETGGYYTRTRAVLEQLLSMQTVQRWVLGQCDFDRQFQYSWENTNLLDAIFSVPTCFDEEYHWTYDTDTFPWTLNLVRQDTDRSCEIRRKRNMQQIKREKDASALITRLYCKGYGEGVNQLTIAEVNNGLPYIDADTIDRYGVICGHLIDHRFTHAETLLARGRAVLEGCKHPRYTYTAKAIDLSEITGLPWDEFDEGKYVHIIDEEKKLDLDAMIVEVSKGDIDGDPLDIDITISNEASDTSDAIEDLAHRTSIAEQYSQGATNLYSQQFADNADAEHPASMRVYVPSECVRINQMLLSWRLSAFRAYETGAAAGGGSERTSSSGGASTSTSTSGGGASIVEEQRIVTTEAVTGGTIAGHSGDTSGNTGYAINSSGASVTTTGEAGGHNHNMQHHHSGPSHTHTINGHTHTGPSHNHGMGHFHDAPSHTHSIDGHTHTGPSHEHGMGHFHNAPSHTHSIDGHTHNGPSHEHGMGHYHNAPSHTHSISSHSHSGPSHTHTGPSHTHSFTSSEKTLQNGHTHTVTCKSSGTSVTSGGVSTNATHKFTVSGTTGSAGSGSTGSAGTGTTSSVSLTTASGGGSLTGGSITSGGDTRNYTTAAGTGATSSTSLTTNSGGGSLTGNAITSSGDSRIYTAASGTGATGSTSLTTNSGGNAKTGQAVTAGGESRIYTTDSGTGATGSTTLTTNAGGTEDTGYAYYAGAIRNYTSDVADHTHGMAHRHNFSHTHNVVAVIHIPALTINIPSHTHSVSIPSHTHSVTIPEHTHDIVYGIYSGSTANSVSLIVDNTPVELPSTDDYQVDELDIVPYLSKDDSGKIVRGTWHEIEIVPDGMTRIEANLFVQTFVNSFTGGNY